MISISCESLSEFYRSNFCQIIFEHFVFYYIIKYIYKTDNHKQPSNYYTYYILIIIKTKMDYNFNNEYAEYVIFDCFVNLHIDAIIWNINGLYCKYI